MDRDTQLDITSSTLTATPETAAPCPLFAQYVKARDLPKFYALQERNQERIKELFRLFEIIQKAPTRDLGYQMASAAANGERGRSAKRLRILYTEFDKCPDWRGLIDNALEYKPNQPMPGDFLQELQQRVDDNGRSISAALKHLRRDWTLGKSIAGYGTWKDWWQLNHPGRPLPRVAPPHPTGWSPENLRRYLDTSKFRRKAATLGRSAASMSRPMVLTTRQGCWVHSHLMWDDVWHDLFVNSFAEKQAGRPLELFSHDYYSARKVRYGIKVRTEDDNGKSQGLTGKMMRMIVAATFYLDGYSPRGTENVAEHGTAAFTEEMARILYDDSGGLITVNRSGMQGDAAHLGQYNGRRTGNPRFKASLESSNNLLHNLEAHLPGQTGPSKERRPEQLHGLLTYNGRLLAAMQQLSPERASLLQFPLLELGQYHQVLADIYRFMEEDTEHSLEGWIQCGHVTQELHLLGEWKTQQEVLCIEGAQRDLVLGMLQAGAVKTRPRLMSRREVWQTGASSLIRIHGGTVCKLLGDDFGKERKVSSHQFCFEDKEVGPGEHRFEAVITDMDGRQFALQDGERYMAFINPFAPAQLFVQDARGRFLGVAPRIERSSRADTDALKRAMGHHAHLEAELLAPLEVRQTKAARTKLKMHRNNAAVLGDAAADQQSTADAAAAALTLAARRKQHSDAAITTLKTTTPTHEDTSAGYR